ncbi:MAG: uroporphyrinogen-III C-methyltransferase [Cognaticolwellia sp.]
MSNKKKSAQNKPANDNPESSANPATADSNNQPGLSTSINLTATAADERVKTSDSKPSDSDGDGDGDKNANPEKTTESKAPLKKASVTTPAKSPVNKAANNSNKLSKTAVLALLIALLAIAASAGHYYWSEQQKTQFTQQINQQLNHQLNNKLQQHQKQIAADFLQQQAKNNEQMSAIETNIQQDSEQKVEQLQQQFAQLSQQIESLSLDQPSDWLLHEAEYLIRVAARSLWLEKNTSAAMGLLTDADRRIQELNDPQFLSLRQVIQQDIAALQLLPTLKTDEVILKLMALDPQIKQLPIAMVNIPASDDSAADLELTENVSDWRENLAKTWRKFIADFITVSRRTGNVEPLMSPQFQQNLRENLSLKLQTAIWAASQAHSEIYVQSLTDIQRWLKEYFDMSAISNENFSAAILALSQETISASYPNKLSSLSAIRDLLSDNTAPTSAAPNSASDVVAPEPLDEAASKTEQPEEL